MMACRASSSRTRPTVGVQRHYTGTAGRIENAQVAVYLVSSAKAGHAAFDRECYILRSWTEDRQRCASAGIPEQFGFAAKPALAARVITRALDSGVLARWVAGDEVYGGNPALRTVLEQRNVPLCPRSRLRPPDRHGGGTAGGCRGQESAQASLAEARSRDRSEGTPLLRLGSRPHCRRPSRAPPAPGPPQPVAQANSPSTAAIHPRPCHRPRSYVSPAAGGRSRRHSSRARGWPDSTSTRSAGGRPGTDGSPSRCSRMPS